MRNYHFLIISIFVLIAGCATMHEASKTMEVYGYDFTPYTEKGFLFTPEAYNGEYDAIGLVYVYLYPEVAKSKAHMVAKKPDAWNTWSRKDSLVPGWYVGSVTASEVLDSLYSVTTRMGANAVIRLKIEYAEPENNGDTRIYGLKASGFAIKRK